MEAQDPIKVRLIEAAGEEFAGKGFECARIRTICDRAGANVAAVNYHFGDKEQLYVATVLERIAAALICPIWVMRSIRGRPSSCAALCIISWVECLRSMIRTTGGTG